MSSPSPSDPNRTEQILSHFLQKSLHAILSSRLPHLSAQSGATTINTAAARRRDKWFHLALGHSPFPIDPPSLSDPLILDILLSPRNPAGQISHPIIERWTLHLDPDPAAGQKSHADASKSYKRLTILLRSIYALLRLLPSFRIFKLFSHSLTNCYNYEFSYRISSFASPFSRSEERELQRFDFSRVDTLLGQLVVYVQYRSSLADYSLEVTDNSSPPIIIMDYIDSPAAEPIRTFPSSLPDRGSRKITYPERTRTSSSSSSSPAGAMLDRPHSWTNAQMAHYYPLARSPGRGSELIFSPPENYGKRPGQGHQRSSFSFDEFKASSPGHRVSGNRILGFDEYKLSPPFSDSPTPSPPAHSNNYLVSRLRSETAPVSIPTPLKGKSQISSSPNYSDPLRSLYPPPSPRTPRTDFSSGSPSESRSFRKSEGLRAGDFYSNLHAHTAQKGLKDGRDDSGRFSAVLSSGGSPRFGFSRSSSRLSIPDDLDDGDFSYPFAVDDVDTSDSQTRSLDGKEAPESASSHKSQDAAVGILVHMLRTAPPLRQDQSCSAQSSKSELTGEVGTSSFFSSRRASDALEELQNYREMKDLLLSRSGSKLTGSVERRKL